MSTNPKDAIGMTKPALRLVPPALMLQVSQAMADGARKYGAYNWREHPVRLTVYIEAALRHLLSLLDGEDRARDSKHHHAAHVGACMAIILDALATGNLIDDRSAGGCAADLIEELTAKPAPAIDPRANIRPPWLKLDDDTLAGELDKPIPFAMTPQAITVEADPFKTLDDAACAVAASWEDDKPSGAV